MQFVQEFDNLCPDAFNTIKKFLTVDQRPFKNSEIYDSRKEVKLENLEERISQFRLFTDAILFEQCDRILAEINKVNEHTHFKIFRNDLTHIKYKEGEFFKPHQDYLSLTGNLVTEYTLLICIDADCKGGETVLHLNRHFKHRSSATVTPGHCLLFRKDICHEGAMVLSGKKEILSLNVWGLDKDKGTDEIVIVTFPNSAISYEIPVKNILALPINNSITAFINFKKNGLNETAVIWHYTELNVDPDDFACIYDIYMQNGLNAEQLKDSEKILDHFGIPYKYILVNSLIAEVQGPVIDSYQNSVTNTLSATSSTQSANENVGMKVDYCNLIKRGANNANVVVCANKHKYRRFLEHVKEDKLPYMPFKVIFAEGSLSYGGGMSDTSPTELKMTPIFATFSEENNVLFLELLLSKNTDIYEHQSYQKDNFSMRYHKNGITMNYGDDDDGEMNSVNSDDDASMNENTDQSKNNKDCGNCNENSDSDERIDSWTMSDDEIDQIPNGTQVYVAGEYIDDEDDRDEEYIATFNFDTFGECVHLNLRFTCDWTEAEFVEWTMDPTQAYSPIPFNICNNRKPKEIIERTENYIIAKSADKNITHPVLAIEPKHMKSIHDRVIELDLFETIKSQLDEVGYKFSQRKSTDHFFCNENVYGNFNFLVVHGFMSI